MQKGLSAGVVSDPAKFTRFIGNVAKHVTVDNSLSPTPRSGGPRSRSG